MECIRNARARYDGEKRNPWDEAECGHHYARAMAAWSGLLALSGFRFDGRTASVTALPRIGVSPFRCFWSSSTGWGSFTCSRAQTEVSFSLRVLAGELPCQSCEMEGIGAKTSASLSGKPLPHKAERAGSHSIFRFSSLTLKEGDELRLRLYA